MKYIHECIYTNIYIEDVVYMICDVYEVYVLYILIQMPKYKELHELSFRK